MIVSRPDVVSSTTKPFSPPLQYDPGTNEPYLPLPAPLGPRIRITPPRFTDITDIENPSSDLSRLVHLLNQPEIYMWLIGPPFPYTKEHGVQWLTARKAECEQAVRDMEDGNQFVSNCPVRFIRERQDNGTDTLLGDIMICRSVFREVEDEEERERKVKENAEREVGDPDIVYSFGDFLSPTHHGRGIMTAAIRTVMEDWAIPCMGARRFEVDTLAENVASQKVFEKNGFVFAGEMKNVVDLAKMGKGEGMLGIRSFVRNGALD